MGIRLIGSVRIVMRCQQKNLRQSQRHLAMFASGAAQLAFSATNHQANITQMDLTRKFLCAMNAMMNYPNIGKTRKGGR